MYLGFYGLGKEPFHVTPDPAFLYLSPSHREAYASLIYGVEHRKGFISLTGEVGSGKTTVLRSYLHQLDRKKTHLIFIFNPIVSFDELLQMLLHEMGIDAKNRPGPFRLQWLHWALIQEFRRGRNVLLVVDEAQNMPVDTLEKLRMLSNIETSRFKLLQIVLSGQPELEAKLRNHALRQLRQRIALRAIIRPLTREESLEYIQHRLTQAGCNYGDILTPGALELIVKAAKGVPRTINILCDNVLVAGFGYRERPVTSKIVREVIRDLNLRPRHRKLIWAFAAAAALVVVSVLGLTLFSKQPSTTPFVPVAEASALPPAPALDQEAAPAPETPAPVPPQRPSAFDGFALLPATDGLTAQPDQVEPPAIPPVEAVTPPAAMPAPPTPAPTMPTSHDVPAQPAVPPPHFVKENDGSRSIVVKPGYKLSSLVLSAYGTCNADLIKMVLDQNRSVANGDIIRVGEKLVFPEVNSTQLHAGVRDSHHSDGAAASARAADRDR